MTHKLRISRMFLLFWLNLFLFSPSSSSACLECGHGAGIVLTCRWPGHTEKRVKLSTVRLATGKTEGTWLPNDNGVQLTSSELHTSGLVIREKETEEPWILFFILFLQLNTFLNWYTSKMKLFTFSLKSTPLPMFPSWFPWHRLLRNQHATLDFYLLFAPPSIPNNLLVLLICNPVQAPVSLSLEVKCWLKS